MSARAVVLGRVCRSRPRKGPEPPPRARVACQVCGKRVRLDPVERRRPMPFLIPCPGDATVAIRCAVCLDLFCRPCSLLHFGIDEDGQPLKRSKRAHGLLVATKKGRRL